MSGILIAYYSLFGATRAAAKAMIAMLDADEVEILPENQYSFDYNTASKEIRNQIGRGFCPRLRSGYLDIGQYGTVFIGSPNWFKNMAPPVLEFVRKHDFKGKKVVPFCAHGGGGFGEIEKSMRAECAGAEFLEGFAVEGAAEDRDIRAWLGRIGML